MHFNVLTIFPHIIEPYIHESIIQKALANGIVSINLLDLRDWTVDKHRTTDDTPFGGGGGMVMKPEPIFSAYKDLEIKEKDSPFIFLTPQGNPLSHSLAKSLSGEKTISILCGRYEGVDQRVRNHLITHEISIGDYVLSGGELPALVLIESITRLLPGALGAPNGAAQDSFANHLLDYPQYTRPAVFEGWEVPEILTSGNHAAIARWRRKQSLLRTIRTRRDLIDKIELNNLDRTLIRELIDEGQIPSLPILKKS